MNTRIQELSLQHTPRSEDSNIKTVAHFGERQEKPNFYCERASLNKRLTKITLKQQAFEYFLSETESIAATDLEYVASNRFFLARKLDVICGNELGLVLKSILNSRAKGAFLFTVENYDWNVENHFNEMLKLATAVSFLFGKANLDAMSGEYYARFTVTNSDDSDTYLRKFSARLTLHNDGTFVKEPTDYVLMMKLHEQGVTGGQSLLLHLDDWEDLDIFSNHEMSHCQFKFSARASKNVSQPIFHPLFHKDSDGRPCLAYIDQFIKPKLFDQAEYVHALGQSLETSKSVLGLEVPVGSLLVCNNHFWLHGRNKFSASSNLNRELMRLRGELY